MEKTKDEILDQLYMSPQDLKMLMPSVGIDVCRNYINEIREQMKKQNLFVPGGKPKLALTKLVRKKCGI